MLCGFNLIWFLTRIYNISRLVWKPILCFIGCHDYDSLGWQGDNSIAWRCLRCGKKHRFKFGKVIDPLKDPMANYEKRRIVKIGLLVFLPGVWVFNQETDIFIRLVSILIWHFAFAGAVLAAVPKQNLSETINYLGGWQVFTLMTWLISFNTGKTSLFDIAIMCAFFLFGLSIGFCGKLFEEEFRKLLSKK